MPANYANSLGKYDSIDLESWLWVHLCPERTVEDINTFRGNYNTYIRFFQSKKILV